ncbi:unnamed protein product [Cylicocyclus nassatus]|uniref:DNA excision repair protein ERCC-8 n=1 Tax=Cylicocyclus nassatus TaxID=53992 RepID=A0AA36HB16_CYLNA|nr:unnamed protein product [Cylicocyclus nassatus]
MDLLIGREKGLVRQSLIKNTLYDERLETLRILRKHHIENVSAAVSCMAIDRVENSFLLCGGISGALYLSNLLVSDFFGGERKEKLTLPASFSHKHFVTGCQWYRDIRLFVSTSSSGELTAWDLTSLSALETYNVCESGKWRPQLHWNEVDKTNPLIAITNGSNNVPLYDLRVGGLAQEVRTKRKTVRAVRWLPSKHHILFCGDNNGLLSVWDVRSNRSALASRLIRPGNSIRGIRVTSDGNHLILVFYNGEVILCDAVTMKELAMYQIHRHRQWTEKMSNALDHFAISDEGTSVRVALPVGDDIDWIRFSRGFREEQSVTLTSTLSAHLSRVNACVYRYGSQQLYTAGADRNVLCWAPECERKRLQLEAESVKVSAITNDDWSDDD